MRFTDFLAEDCIRPGLRARDGAGVLRELAGLLATSTQVPCGLLEELLVARERIASTAIGRGVAVPHCRFERLPRSTACVAVHPEGMDFGARDGRPVRLFVVLASPENPAGMHLGLLARIAALLRNDRLREALLDAPDATAIRRLFVRAEDAYLASLVRPDPGQGASSRL